MAVLAHGGEGWRYVGRVGLAGQPVIRDAAHLAWLRDFVCRLDAALDVTFRCLPRHESPSTNAGVQAGSLETQPKSLSSSRSHESRINC